MIDNESKSFAVVVFLL